MGVSKKTQNDHCLQETWDFGVLPSLWKDISQSLMRLQAPIEAFSPWLSKFDARGSWLGAEVRLLGLRGMWLNPTNQVNIA